MRFGDSLCPQALTIQAGIPGVINLLGHALVLPGVLPGGYNHEQKFNLLDGG